MLKMQNTIKAKTMRGKKYRSSLFYWFLAWTILALIVAYIWSSIAFADTETDGITYTILICLLATAIPFTLCMMSLPFTCVLGDDRLYFFGGQLTRFPCATRKSKSTAKGNGFLHYADIEKLQFTIAHYERVYTRRELFSLMPSVITVSGADFELIIIGSRALARALEEKIRFARPAESTESEPLPDKDTIFGGIVAALRAGRFETLWGEDATLIECQYNEDDVTIDMLVEKNGKQFAFNIDETSVFMMDLESEETITKASADFACAEDAISHIKCMI